MKKNKKIYSEPEFDIFSFEFQSIMDGDDPDPEASTLLESQNVNSQGSEIDGRD